MLSEVTDGHLTWEDRYGRVDLSRLRFLRGAKEADLISRRVGSHIQYQRFLFESLAGVY